MYEFCKYNNKLNNTWFHFYLKLNGDKNTDNNNYISRSTHVLNGFPGIRFTDDW